MRRSLLMLLGAVWCALAQRPPAPPANEGKGSRPPAARRETPPLSGANSAFDISMLDRAANPCVDFYQYSCGAWLQRNPIPPDEAGWGRFNELQERNRAILRDILEAASKPEPNRSFIEREIGDYYAACMDESAIERKGLEPAKAELDRIAALPSKAALTEELVRLHQRRIHAFFLFDSQQDFKNASQMIAYVDQSGLGLPDRDYYLKTDPKSVELRGKYVQHIQRTFQLAGDDPPTAARKAQTVMKIETDLAKASLDVVSRRDPAKQYHMYTVHELVSLDPGFDWAKYFTGMGVPNLQNLNVVHPPFLRQVETVTVVYSLDDLKTYLSWSLLHSVSGLLSKAFVDERFDFYGRTLSGARELQARWKRCVESTDALLGDALGQKYVEKTFGAEGKQRTLKMVREIEAAMQKDIESLDWMSPETKKQALIKLHAITNKIGYPDKWKDYSSATIARDDAFGNAMRLRAWSVQHELEKIGKPVDKTEWQMSPPTVNAYYDPQMNDINFPAGILQPPFYSNNIDDAVNYGAIGAVIGHELTHGFDDEGRQFDAQGNLRDWWKPEDARRFEERTDCLVKEYSSFSVEDSVHVNGKLTLGENTADNGGIRLALMAFLADLANKPKSDIDGFTPEQRFFLGYGQIWCENVSPELARMLANVDPHSPPRYRVNGVLSNMPEFQKAFGCAAGQPMVRRPACRVW
ncbi:MAG TPA: M13 family metallopeptidase [Bryobacteraceae bacterium]|jgi:putative endopeptidase|nr:M13 family metallopeptidase [Bryobacteraceae bacterium]